MHSLVFKAPSNHVELWTQHSGFKYFELAEGWEIEEEKGKKSAMLERQPSKRK